jgi:CheY-like chemotaxis protein
MNSLRKSASAQSPPRDHSGGALEHGMRSRLVRNGAPCRILIVEDDALIALDLQHTIEDLGGAVVGRASRTSEAIGLAVKHQPDVVLMDIRLAGGSDGIEAARGIRRLQEVPIIFVTGNADPATRERVLELSNVSLLNKPVDHRLLGSTLRDHCAQKCGAANGSRAS